jgi:hypothetical protein
MPKDKNSGKKLADMLYGNPEGAAFGVYPQMKGKRSKQDPEAAKNVPVDVARGFAAGALGMPGDIESLIRMLPGLDEQTVLPTSEDILKRIPFGTDTPAGKAASGLGILGGGFYTGPGSAARAITSVPKAVKRAGLDFAESISPVNVIKPKGGNWLGGRLPGNIDDSVSRLRPYSKAGDDGTFLQKDLERAKQRLEMLEADPYKMESMVNGQRQTIEEIKKKIALNNWVESNLGKYVKNQMATPEDPIRLLLDKRTKEIEAKHAKDMERAERMAQRAMDEPDPRRQANMIRESDRLKIEANVERQFAMDSIIPSRMRDYSPEADYSLKQRRQEAGFPAEGMGESEAAKRYETLTDDAISTMRAGDVQETKNILAQAQDAERAFKTKQLDVAKRFDEHLRASGLNENEIRVLNEKTPITEKADIIQDREYGELGYAYNKLRTDIRRDEFAAGQENPFIDKLDPETQLYSGNTADMGFDHVIDILKQDVEAGRIRPEQLNRVSVEDAVRRTMEFDQEAAKKMAEAQIKNMEGFPVYKEYPEGYRWVELKKPEDLPEGYSLDDMGNVVDEKGHITNHPGEKRLEEALKYEGDTMGHCVGGYCPDVLEGKSRIFSLRDARGEPHVTVEVNPSSQRVAPRHEEIVSEMKASGLDLNQLDEPAYDAAYEQALQRVKQNRPPAIAQIKGKQNAAPKAEYLPYVQDFVKSGKYSEVGDLENTGLYSARDVMNYMPENFTMSRNARQLAVGRARMAGEMPDYMTKAEYEAMLQKHAPEDIWNAEKAQRAAEDDELLRQLQPPPEEGMAGGGRVHISDNPDVMALELQAGGLVKGLKAAAKASKAEKELALPPVLPRAPAKTREEIRPYAQRMAQQMTGEFYRPNPKKSENVAGKSFSQFKMEKGLEHDIRPTREVVEPEVADIEKQLGMLKIGISGDTTIADKVLRRAGPYELFDPSPQHGGPRYGLGGEGAWASNNPIAATVQKRVNELSEAYGAPPLGQYMAMGPQGSNFAQHFADANLQAIDTSAMTKAQIEQINKLIREGSQKSGPRPSFPGIEDRGSAYLHFAIDPELRKHFNDLMQKTSVTEKLNLPDGRIILHAITEPELRDKEILNTGFSQMRLKSAFDPESLQISAHPTYSHVIPHEEGSAVTRTKYLTPGELEFSDVLDYAKQHYRPQDMTRVFQTSTPRQIVDPQHIDEMKMYEELMKEYTGKKAGGAVRMAGGGEVHGLSTADLLFLQSQEDLGKLPAHAQREAITNMGGQEVRQRMAGKMAGGGSAKVEQKVQVPMSSQKKSEQRVQNPVHFTESPDVMRLALTQRN